MLVCVRSFDETENDRDLELGTHTLHEFKMALGALFYLLVCLCMCVYVLPNAKDLKFGIFLEKVAFRAPSLKKLLRNINFRTYPGLPSFQIHRTWDPS